MKIVIIVTLIIALIFNIKEKKVKEPPKIIKYDTRTGTPVYEGEEIIGYDTKTGRPIIKGREERKQKELLDKTKVSNSVLMIVGAVLVVFAAIVFLASSWNTIDNIIKTIIIFLVQAVFFAFYKICTNKLQIPKTGRVFKYLSFIFIPIVLVSLSCFELVGEDLSIGGQYESLYFIISFIISAVIYKIFAKKNDEKPLKIFSYILESLAVLLLDDLINIFYVSMTISAIYTLVYYTLMAKNILKKKDYNTINYIFIIFNIIITSVSASSEAQFIYYIPLIIYTIFFFVAYLFIKDEKENNNCVYLFLANYGLVLSSISLLEEPSALYYLLGLIPLLFFAKFTKNEQAKHTLQWIIFAITILMTHSLLIVGGADKIALNVLAIFTCVLIYIMLLVFFPKYKKIYKYATYISFAIFTRNLFIAIDITDLNKYILLIIPIFICLFEELLPTLKDNFSKYLICLLLSLESIILGFETLAGNPEYLLLAILLMMTAYGKIEKSIEDYVIVPALSSLSLFISASTTLNIIICIALIMAYSFKSLIDKKSNIFTFISLISILIGLPLLEVNSYIVFIPLGLWSILHLLFMSSGQSFYKVILIASCFGIYTNALIDIDVDYISLYFLGVYASLIAIFKLAVNKETTTTNVLQSLFFIIISLIAMIATEEGIDNIMLNLILLATTLYYFTTKSKILLYTSLSVLILKIIIDTFEFWSSLPIYVYILIIGLILIFFAMFNEKKDVKQQEKISTNEKENNDRINENKDNIE